MDGQISFIFEQRQPIKGYPELHGRGKGLIHQHSIILHSLRNPMESLRMVG